MDDDQIYQFTLDGADDLTKAICELLEAKLLEAKLLEAALPAPDPASNGVKEAGQCDDEGTA